MTYGKPLPNAYGDSRDFREGCRRHELRFQKCGGCGRLRWPPAILCPHCLSRDTELVTASGRGTVYSYAVYHVAFDRAFKEDIPYIVVLVALEEGPRLLTNLVGCEPGQVSCDMAVEVVWDDVTDTVTLPRFRPATR